MFHLLLLFWKCNYLRYRGLNGDSLAGERFHLPKVSFLVAFPFFLPQVAPPPPPRHLSGRKQSGFLLTGRITLLAMKKNHIYSHFLHNFMIISSHIFYFPSLYAMKMSDAAGKAPERAARSEKNTSFSCSSLQCLIRRAHVEKPGELFTNSADVLHVLFFPLWGGGIKSIRVKPFHSW